MPIVFKSKHAPDVLMLDAVALELIRMMGHGGAVPGSLAHEDIAAALTRLESAIAEAPGRPLPVARERDDEEDNREPRVSVAHRALPLIGMLRTALAENDYVIWDR